MSGAVCELEHVIGFTGRHPNSLCLHPSHETGVVCALGATVVLGDVTDPHEQIFLLGHTADVTCIDVAQSGRLIASGQLRQATSARGDAAVILWDALRRTRLHTLSGITGAVAAVRISPDERFLAAVGADLTLIIWDISNGEVVHAGAVAALRSVTAGPAPVGFMCWLPLNLYSGGSGPRPAYAVALNAYEKVQVVQVQYDHRIMRYALAGEPLQATLPASGFLRSYLCGAVCGGGGGGPSLLCGTTAGELVTFALTPALTFKSAVLAASHGLSALVVPPPPPGQAVAATAIVYCGGGDGSVRCYVQRQGTSAAAPLPGFTSRLTSKAGVAALGGRSALPEGPYAAAAAAAVTGSSSVAGASGSTDWECIAAAAASGRMTSLALPPSGAWLLAASDAGLTYRVAFGCDLRAPPPPPPPLHGAAALSARCDVLESAHTGPVRAMAVCPMAGAGAGVVSAGADGSLRVWSLETYDVAWAHALPAAAAGPSPGVPGGGAMTAAAASLPLCVWAAAPLPGAIAAAAAPAAARGAAGAATVRLNDRGTGGRGASHTGAGAGPALLAAAAAAAAAAVADGAATGAGGAPLPIQLYCGFGDGTLRAYDAFARASVDGREGTEAWRVQAHRGALTCLHGSARALVSGGADGRVCVWARANGAPLLQFAEHAGAAVVGVRFDAAAPELLYSVAEDRALVVYSLRAERRVRTLVAGGAAGALRYTCLAQTAGSSGSTERELFTGTRDGRIICWDSGAPDGAAGAVDLLALLPVAAAAASGGGDSAPAPAPLPPRGTERLVLAGSSGGGDGGVVVPRVTGSRNRSSLGGILGTGSAEATAAAAAAAAAAQAPGRGGGGGGLGAPGAAASASSARPECCVTALAVSPDGLLLAAVTHTGFLAVLAIGRDGPAAAVAAAPATSAGSGMYSTSSGGRGLPRITASCSGAASSSAAGGVSAMRLCASFRGFSPFLAVCWSPDQKQLIVAAQDACISVFNYYG